MKLLVSDYDGTLNPEGMFIRDFKINLDAVKKFINSGNKFMLSTGRNLTSIEKEIKKYNIPFNYLSCNDGAILFDDNFNILHGFHMDENVVKSIISTIKTLCIGENIRMYDADGLTFDTDKILELQVASKILKIKSDLEVLRYITSEYPSLDIMTILNMHFIKQKGGKSRSIKIVSDMISPERIVTVGDNINDLEMLQDYEGYKVLLSYPSLYGKKIKTVHSVKSLIKKLEM